MDDICAYIFPGDMQINKAVKKWRIKYSDSFRGKNKNEMEIAKMENKNNTIIEYEYAYNHGEDIFQPLNNLAQFVTFSVYKKIYNKTLSDDIRTYRIECKNGINSFDKIKYSLDVSEHGEFDSDGNIYISIDDKQEHKNANDFIHSETIGDGYDILQEANIIIMEESKKFYDKYGYLDLLQPYTIKKLDKHIVIKRSDSAAVKEEETTVLRQIFLKTRAYIARLKKNKSELNSPYSYYEDDSSEDSPEYDGIADKSIYRRLDKYSVFVDEETDINGKNNGYSVHEDGVNGGYNGIQEAEKKITELNKLLSPVQKDILKYRLKGCGYKAIGTLLNKKPETIKGHIKHICDKAKKIGIVSDIFYSEQEDDGLKEYLISEDMKYYNSDYISEKTFWQYQIYVKELDGEDTSEMRTYYLHKYNEPYNIDKKYMYNEKEKKYIRKYTKK